MSSVVDLVRYIHYTSMQQLLFLHKYVVFERAWDFLDVSGNKCLLVGC